MKRVLELLASIGVCLVIGYMNSTFMAESMVDWYPSLIKPFFTPPAWIFGPVWVVLYITMGIALFIVWDSRNIEKEKERAIILFVIQLAINALWGPAFFGLRSTLAGLIVIVPLTFVVIWTTIVFMRISKIAGIFMIPYVSWMSFATVLNAAIFYLNVQA